MKRKIRYGLLVLAFLILLYVGLRYTLGLFTPFNYFTAIHDIKNNKIQIVEIGELPLNFEQKQKLANLYGFSFYHFGDDVTPDVMNGVKHYNKKMLEYLKSKHGAGWWVKFQAKLDSIDSSVTQQITKDLIKGNWYLNIWTMYHTLSFSDSIVFVDNHIDSVFYCSYSIKKDTLILKNKDRKIIYKNRIIAISQDTLVIKSLGKVADTLHYSRIKRNWKKVL